MPLNRKPGCSLVLGLFALVTACNNGTNTDMSYKAAINDHYKAFPVCLWSQAKKFPVQAATSDDAKTEGYDALTQEGLLTRTTAEKKVLIIASKQVNNYDLSDKGRTSWTPDSSQPGYGNFCYGNREATSIDNSTLGTNGSGSKTVHSLLKTGPMKKLMEKSGSPLFLNQNTFPITCSLIMSETARFITDTCQMLLKAQKQH